MQALSILRKHYPFLDFHGLTPIQDKVDPKYSNDVSLDFEGFTPVQDINDLSCTTKQQIQNNDEVNIEEGEFSFAYADVQRIHIFADDLIENGKIRTLFLI